MPDTDDGLTPEPEKPSLPVFGPTEPTEVEAEEYYKAGLFLLKRNKPAEALAAFRHSFNLKTGELRYMSYYGLCIALTEGRAWEGLALCEKAVTKDPNGPELLLNLGRAFLAVNDRKKAHMAFRKGLSIDRDNKGLKVEIERMGIRKPSVFPFLERQHPLNKFAGKVLYKLKLR